MNRPLRESKTKNNLPSFFVTSYGRTANLLANGYDECASTERVSVEVFERWEEWKQYLLRYMFDHNPHMVPLYNSFNYDVTPVLKI